MPPRTKQSETEENKPEKKQSKTVDELVRILSPYIKVYSKPEPHVELYNEFGAGGKIFDLQLADVETLAQYFTYLN